MIQTKQAMQAQLHAALAQLSAMRADNNQLRQALADMLHHFGNTKRDEWLNDEGFAAAQAVEAKARALVLFVPQFPYVVHHDTERRCCCSSSHEPPARVNHFWPVKTAGVFTATMNRSAIQDRARRAGLDQAKKGPEENQLTRPPAQSSTRERIKLWEHDH